MPILTVAELRKHIPDHPAGDDADDALQHLLDAAEAAIVRVAGAPGAMTEFGYGGWRHIFMARPVATVTSITEDYDGTPVTLAVDDYRVNGYIIERLSGGTNPTSYWRGTVVVSYIATTDDEAERAAVQVALIKLFIDHHPGLTSETIGEWSQTFAANSVFNYAIERDTILSTLARGGRMVVV